MQNLAVQLFINGLVLSARYFLVGIGFLIIWVPCRFIHFTHAAVIAFASYTVYIARTWLGVPLPLSLLLGITCGAVMGYGLELALYRPLRRRDASLLVLMLASLGAYITLQNLLSLVFGDDPRSIHRNVSIAGANVLGARITMVQVITILIGLLLLVGLTVILKHTKFGKAIRAVADDPILAKISGIDDRQLVIKVFVVGSILASIAGILIAFDLGVVPGMGLEVFLMGIVAMIIGGVNSIPGIALGALLLGMAQQFGVWKIGSQWQDAIAFIILLAFLLFRPQGFLGRKTKKAVVR